MAEARRFSRQGPWWQDTVNEVLVATLLYVGLPRAELRWDTWSEGHL